MTLHEKLLAATGPLPAFTPLRRSTINKPRDALRAVLELHAPVPCSPPCSMRHEHLCCRWCRGYIWPATESLVAWPCPTIDAIARELEIESD